MERNKIVPVVLIALAATLLNWGVAYENTKLNIQAGNSYQFYTELQNMETTAKNISIRLSGDEITKIADKYYILQPKERRTVLINISVPQNPSKETYSVVVIYTAIPITSGISITTQKSITISIKVLHDSQAVNSGTQSSTYQTTTNNQTIANQTTQILQETQSVNENKNLTSEEIGEPKAGGIGVGVIISDPLIAYIIIAIVVGTIVSGGYIMWKKGVIDEIRDLTGI